MANADMKVEVAAAMKSYLTSQVFKDIIVKSVKEAVGQAVESILKELKAEIAVLEGRVKTLEDTIEKVAAKANDNEQFSRRQNVRVTGFVEEEEENCTQKFVNLCREKIGLDVSDEIVDRAHRVVFPPKKDTVTSLIFKYFLKDTGENNKSKMAEDYCRDT